MNQHFFKSIGFDKTKVYALVASAIYLFIIGMLLGLKPENWLIAGSFNLLIWLSRGSRKFILGFSIFLVFGILYDFMKVCPNYTINPVDIAGLYNFEKSTFGFMSNGILVTPNEYFALHHHAILDFFAGLFYLNWVPVPLAFAVWLYFKNKKQFLNFSLTFLFVNLIGFCGYYLHPAAPPWYIAKYGFELIQGTGGNTAGLGRFDQMMGIGVFDALYSRNSNVFAAMPSLHCAYPLIVFYYSFKANVKPLKWISGVLTLGIWWTAVYSGHHYVMDAIMGIICTLIGIAVFQYILLRWNPFRRFISGYEKLIS